MKYSDPVKELPLWLPSGQSSLEALFVEVNLREKCQNNISFVLKKTDYMLYFC